MFLQDLGRPLRTVATTRSRQTMQNITFQIVLMP